MYERKKKKLPKISERTIDSDDTQILWADDHRSVFTTVRTLLLLFVLASPVYAFPYTHLQLRKY